MSSHASACVYIVHVLVRGHQHDLTMTVEGLSYTIEYFKSYEC